MKQLAANEERISFETASHDIYNPQHSSGLESNSSKNWLRKRE